MRTLDPRLLELGMIRIGDQVETKTGKKRPEKLDAFRFTSVNKLMLDQIATLYGGEVVRWEDAPTTGQWQLYSTANNIDVTLPDLGAFSLSYERWAGGACTLRCNGNAVLYSDRAEEIGRPCLCPGDEELQAQGHTLDSKERCPSVARLSIILNGISGIGVWRLNTQSYYAAAELKGLILQLQNMGITKPVKCWLRLQERQRKSRVGGKTVPRKFAVPVLTPQYNYQELLALASNPHVPMLEAPVERAVAIQRGVDAAADVFGGGMDVRTQAPPVDEQRERLMRAIYAAGSARGYSSHTLDTYLQALASKLTGSPEGKLSTEHLQQLLEKIPTWEERKGSMGEDMVSDALSRIRRQTQDILHGETSPVADLFADDAPPADDDSAGAAATGAAIADEDIPF